MAIFLIITEVFSGYMAEWFKAIVLKTIVFKRYRGFESHFILYYKVRLKFFNNIF